MTLIEVKVPSVSSIKILLSREITNNWCDDERHKDY